ALLPRNVYPMRDTFAATPRQDKICAGRGLWELQGIICAPYPRAMFGSLRGGNAYAHHVPAVAGIEIRTTAARSGMAWRHPLAPSSVRCGFSDESPKTREKR